ncbi:MAG: hypothetical protein IPL55_04145 [Saprospiraceae bacterium]|nr:hypothetical protein [Saprospiraceae bacterium]
MLNVVWGRDKAPLCQPSDSGLILSRGKKKLLTQPGEIIPVPGGDAGISLL